MMELKAYWDGLSGFGKFKFVLKIILVILAMLFAIFNWQSVEVDLVFLKINLPVTVLILMCMVIGFILSSVFDYKRFKKKDEEIAELKKQITNGKNQNEAPD